MFRRIVKVQLFQVVGLFSAWAYVKKYIYDFFYSVVFFQHRAVSGLQGRQKTPSVKKLRTFRRILVALRVGWQNSAPRIVSTLERRDENIK